MTKITPILMCGGVGKRLWPVSRKVFLNSFILIFPTRHYFKTH